ncbi:oligogalacturonate lyase family protein [Nonomuraea sp. NPDC050547]|uniref:oligogalacturonate lyase family protein n=1 Tax=unclassified Nonomuraea TaxID=2593643 RepID=UPI0037BC8D2A
MRHLSRTGHDLVLTGAHLTYPHANGFHAGGERLLVSTYGPRTGERGISSVAWRGGEPDERPLCAFTAAEPVWPDVAPAAEVAAWVRDGALYVLDLGGGEPEPVHRGRGLQGLCSITADGRRVVVMEHDGEAVDCLEVSLATGAVTRLFREEWFANHPHHSPHDEDWLAYSHEGPANEIGDRVWAYHQGERRRVFDQRGMAAGHERWMFHDLGALVCVYGVSERGPRGLYAVHPDGRPARLVSEGERIWHCDISRDGRHAVVDTTGPHDEPGRGWDDARQISDVLLIDVATGEQTFLARTGADTHPRHPHPIFTPDGSAVLYNHGDPATGQVAVAVRTI